MKIIQNVESIGAPFNYLFAVSRVDIYITKALLNEKRAVSRGKGD